MASVTPRKNPSGTVNWRVQYRVGGRLRQETFTTEKAALQFGALVDRVGGEAARQVRRARQHRDVGIPTLREWATTYLDVSRGHLAAVTDATVEGYQKIAERSFLPRLGDLPLDAIGAQEVAQWVHWQERQPTDRSVRARRLATERHEPLPPVELLSAKTVRNYHAVLSAMLEAAAKAGHVPANVAKGAKISDGVPEEMVFLTPAEFEAVYGCLPEYARPLARFLIGTGFRWGEATALTWGDIDFAATPPTARVTKAWKRGPGSSPVLGPPKTPKSRRTVSLPEIVIEELGQHGAAAERVFPSPRGAGQRRWTRQFHEEAWNPAVLASGIAKLPRVHDLRHSHVSWLIAAGASLPMIQARLGHEKITTTIGTYGHLYPEAHAQMANLMDRAMVRLPTALPLDPGAVA